MNRIIETLKAQGCDTSVALDRVLGDEEFYLDCLHSFAGEEAFTELGRYLREQNIRESFSCAHTLKGVSANLGLTPMYRTICAIVEPLRTGKTDGVKENYRELMVQFDDFRQLLYGT